MVRGGNAQLRNHYKNRYGEEHVWCPFCLLNGTRVRLAESHVILACPMIARERCRLKITSYAAIARRKGWITNLSILKAYLGGDGASKMKLLDRGRKMAVLLDAWLSVSEGLVP